MREGNRKIYIIIGICLVILTVITLLYLTMRLVKSGVLTSQTKNTTTTRAPQITVMVTDNPPVTMSYPDSPADVEFIESYSSKEAELRPDLTVKNTTPLTYEDIYITTEYMSKGQGYFTIVVYSDLEPQDAMLRVDKWLDSIGIPPESKSKLKIDFRRRTDPDYM